MSGPADGPPAARTLLSVPATGGHGTARLEAVTAIAEALGCQARSRDLLTGYYDRSAHGDYYLTIWGPPRTVTWLRQGLPGIVAGLDQAAAAATRVYATWLREGCPEGDHMPAERPGLRARWRREYLRAYGTTLAARISGRSLPAAGPADTGQLYRAHWGWAAGQHDAARASLAPYTPPPAPVTEDSPLRGLPAAARALPARPGTCRGQLPAGRG